MDGNAPRPFDLRQMSNALPPANPGPSSMDGRRPSAQYAVPSPTGMMGSGPYQYNVPAPQYGQQRPDSAAFARAHQQPYLPQNYATPPGQYHMASRPQTAQIQTQPPYPRVDPYVYGVAQPAYSPVDMRYPQHSYPVGYGAPGGYADMGQYPPRRDSEPAAEIPSFPRGPPRKPKQSGHALWVGNLPPAANVTDLKDHFSRDATTDIQSLFLISKSNCAFVNYRTEAACVAAMNRFHDSRFHGTRLVCRLRRGSASTTTSTTPAAEVPPASGNAPDSVDGGAEDGIPDPVIVGGTPQAPSKADQKKASPSEPPAVKVPEKFFIVKSLTLQDLEASVRNGIWATQSHNEGNLNKAYAEADNVYLVFSANKSGEYFGYARMASPISGEPVPIGSAPPAQSPVRPTTSDGPKSIPTPATETAPRGRIIDDSARGTIFWEAESSEDEGNSSPQKEVEEDSGSQDLGRPFKIEWVSTARLPFYRTRGLRNSWNANREVKIARDGTELEPSVGKRLVQMFHRPAQMVGPPPPMMPGGMPYTMA